MFSHFVESCPSTVPSTQLLGSPATRQNPRLQGWSSSESLCPMEHAVTAASIAHTSSFEGSPDSSGTSADSCLSESPPQITEVAISQPREARVQPSSSKLNIQVFPDTETDAEPTSSTPLLQDRVSQKLGNLGLSHRRTQKNKKSK